MAFEINQDDTVSVTAYSLHEFAFDLTYLGSKGFTCSLENSKCPWGGVSGGMYNATLVKLTDYYISLDGTHMNSPEQEAETSKETALKDDSSDVSGVGGTDVSETANVAKTAVKRTPTKKTT